MGLSHIFKIIKIDLMTKCSPLMAHIFRKSSIILNIFWGYSDCTIYCYKNQCYMKRGKIQQIR